METSSTEEIKNVALTSTKEKWYITVLFYFPRLISHIFSAFDMSDKGWSLKKILAAFSTYEAAKVTDKLLEPNNVIVFTIIWLIYAGILVGIYSLSDISKAASSFRQTSVQNADLSSQNKSNNAPPAN